MANNNEQKETAKKSVGQYLRKNGTTILLGIGLVVIIVSPDAKSWVLRQLMVTGIFNAQIDSNRSEKTADFNFQDKHGNIATLSSLKGKVVFINFWASWCPPCRAEFPSVMSLYDKFRDDPNVFFLMTNEDDNLSAAEKFLEKEKYVLPLFRTTGKIPDVVYTGTLPTTVVLDKTGKIRYHHEGFANYGSEKFIDQIENLVKE